VNNILREIEGKYPVDTILVNGEQVWPYLRIAYGFAYVGEDASQWAGKQSVPPLPKRFMRMVRSSFYGLRNWFGRYDYVVFSNTLERRNINGEYVNKLLDPIMDEMGQETFLYVETPNPSLYPIKRVHTRNVVSHDLLTLLSAGTAVLLLVIRKKYAIENGSMVKAIQQEYGLHIDDARKVSLFDAQRRVASLLFRKIKPKAILLSCYYGSNLPVVKAARDLGIKVIEVQHGVIGKEHPAYNVDAAIDKSYFPGDLLVFGRRELETFDNSRFIEPENVYPVGSFYIEHIRKNYKAEAEVAEQLRNYRRSVAVTLDYIMEKRAIEFVCQAADLDRTVLYLLVPRLPHEKHYSSLSLPANVTVVKDKNFYELMMYVDFHSTVWSTCALEAPSLGVQNILINIDDLSKQYYGTVLSDNRTTRYADTPGEFVNTINSFEKLDKDTIIMLNEHIIASNYRDNIKNFIVGHLR
jgi:hypothetical protein